MIKKINRKDKTVFERLEREIHGLMVDLGLDEQRTDEFLDQEDMVKRFMDEWGKAIEKVEKKVIQQVEDGKTEVTI